MRGHRHLNVLGALLLAAAAPAIVAHAEVITGSNATLDDNGGRLYIPLTPSASGTLGEDGVGLSPDTVTLVGGDSAGGWVDFALSFDVADAMGGEAVDPTQPLSLTLTFRDIDFRPVVSASGGLRRTYRESLEMAFLRDAADDPGAGAITIDHTNYMTYRLTPGSRTDDRTCVYSLDLTADLGVTQADIDAMNADGEFGLYVRLASYVESYGRGRGRPRSVTLHSGPEDLGGSFQVIASGSPVPEPAALGVLALGGIALIARRRRT